MVQAHAATYHLKNGDKIQGKEIARTGGVVTVQHAFMGELKIPLDQIEKTEPAKKKPLKAANSDIQVSAKTAEKLESVNPKQTGKGKQKPDPEAEQEEKKEPWYAIWDYRLPENWDGRLGFAFTKQTERSDKEQIDLTGRLKWNRTKKDGFVWESYYEYDKISTGRKTRDEWGASQQYRRQINDSWFLQSLTQNDSDYRDDVRWDAVQTVGVGWNVFKDKSYTLKIIPGAGVRYREKENMAPEEEKLSPSVFLEQNFRWKINHTLRVFQDFEYFLNPDFTQEWTAEFEGGVGISLMERVELRFVYEWEYDNTLDPKRDPKDAEFVTRIVLKL